MNTYLKFKFIKSKFIKGNIKGKFIPLVNLCLYIDNI